MFFRQKRRAKREISDQLSALLWSVPPRYLEYLYAQFGYLHRLFCKLGVNSVNMVGLHYLHLLHHQSGVNRVNRVNGVSQDQMLV